MEKIEQNGSGCEDCYYHKPESVGCSHNVYQEEANKSPETSLMSHNLFIKIGCSAGGINYIFKFSLKKVLKQL